MIVMYCLNVLQLSGDSRNPFLKQPQVSLVANSRNQKLRLNSRLEAALTGGFLRSNISEALRKQEGAKFFILRRKSVTAFTSRYHVSREIARASARAWCFMSLSPKSLVHQPSFSMKPSPTKIEISSSFGSSCSAR